MVATPKRAGIKKSNKHILKNHEKFIRVTPLIPTIKANQFHSLPSPSCLLKYGFASSKKEVSLTSQSPGRLLVELIQVMHMFYWQKLCRSWNPFSWCLPQVWSICHISCHGVKVLINGIQLVFPLSHCCLHYIYFGSHFPFIFLLLSDNTLSGIFPSETWNEGCLVHLSKKCVDKQNSDSNFRGEWLQTVRRGS